MENNFLGNVTATKREGKQIKRLGPVPVAKITLVFTRFGLPENISRQSERQRIEF